VRAPHAAALVLVGVSAIIALIVAALFGDTRIYWIVVCVASAALLATAVWASIRAARVSTGRRRWLWSAMTVGLLGWAAGTALSVTAAPGTVAASVPADAAHVAFWLAACALILVPATRWDASWMRIVLDAMAVGAALFVVAWALVVQVIYRADAQDARAAAVSITCLSATVVVTTLAVLVVARVGGRQRLFVVTLATGVIVLALTRATSVLLVAGDAADAAAYAGAGWVVGILLIAVAATLEVTAVPEVRESAVPPRTSLWLPYLPIAIASFVAAAAFMGVPQLAPMLGAALVMVMCVIVRQFLVLWDNRRLMVAFAEQALRDPLTGVGNRALFADRLTHAVDLRQRDRSPITVLALDLEDFKMVNVSLGHPAGDCLLTAVAGRLLSCLRTGDTVARVGGDEFAVLMEGDLDSARAVAHRVEQSFDQPFVIEGHEVMIRPSIGVVAISGHDSDVSGESLLARAEAAMHAARADGLGGLRTYSAELADRQPAVSAARGGGTAVQLLGELRRAIDRAELSVVYQPQIDLATGAVVGVEALVRWPHPELGVLEPDRFLPLVRHHGLMPAVTGVVVGKALDDLASWHEQGCAVRLAVNLFAPSLGDVELPLTVAWGLAERNLPAELLTIEITEDLVLDNLHRTRSILGDLRARGIRISIDDFGSGYSALSYMRELPVDEMKICRELVQPIVDDPRAEAVVGAVIEVAHVLGAAVVAEGVEDEHTDIRLRQLGCDVGQGFYYSRPLGYDTVTALLAAQSGRRFDRSVLG